MLVLVYTPDTVRPQLSNVTVNMFDFSMTFTFSEAIDQTTFNLTGTEIFDNVNSHQLRYGVNLTISDDSTVVTVLFVRSDIDDLQLLPTTVISLESSSVRILTSLVKDFFGNPVGAVVQSAIEFTPDTIRPRVLGYSVNMDASELTLTFSEIMNATSVQLSNVFLSSPDSGFNFTLVNATTLTTDGLELTLGLSKYEQDSVKVHDDFYVSARTSLITLTSTSIVDMVGNELIPLSNIAADSFVNDTTSPVLLQTRVDLTQETLSLKFSEIVRNTTLNVSEITLVNLPGGSITFVPSSSSVISYNGRWMTISFSSDDLNELKRLDNLFTSQADSHIRFTTNFIEDMVGNAVVAVSTPIQVDSYTADLTRPEIVAFSVNMTSEILTVTFDETVESLSVSPSGFIFESAAFPSATLTSFDFVSPSSTVVSFGLATVDLDIIKYATDSCISTGSCTLNITSSAIQDKAGNQLVPKVLTASNFVEDKVRPTLLQFDLNMNTGTIELLFDETMESNSLDINSITLSGPASSYTLTNSASTSGDGTRFVINIGITDLNSIKYHQVCHRSEQSACSLAIVNTTITDMNANMVVSTTRIVDTYVVDSTPPTVVAYDIDMANLLLNITFDEAVNSSSISFGSSLRAQISTVSLSGNNYVDLQYGSVAAFNALNTHVSINIDPRDAEALRQFQVFVWHQSSDAWLRVFSTFIDDMSYNDLAEFSPVTPARVFIEDDISPAFIGFSMNMDQGNITLTFSETVRGNQIQPAKITLHNSDTSYTLTSSVDQLNEPNFNEVHVKLSTADYFAILADSGLATNGSNTYMTIDAATVFDTNENANILTQNVSVSNFVEDQTAPSLVAATSVDMTTGVVHLDFSEPMPSRVIDRELSIETSKGVVQGSFSSVASQAVNNIPQSRLVLQMSEQMRLDLALLGLVASDTLTVNITESFVTDKQGNAVTRASKQASTFVLDARNPQLEFFTIDMNEGSLYLEFDAPVNSSTVNTPALTL
jgi:hypothetical protein